MTSRKAVRPQADGLSVYLESRRKLVEKALARSVPAAAVRPSTLHRAMRYSLLAGGKRLRPILALAAAEACGAKDPANVLPAACAVELIHTYSLIHDDLPCMDDDDLRRGKPTSHKVFGEGIAVLTGDALLTRAFGLLATVQPSPKYHLSRLLGETAEAAGSLRLIAGQVADLEAEGRKLSIRDVRFIHERKTAAMIVLPLRLGAMIAGASRADLDALSGFGTALGLAFQIQDDILDVTQPSEKLGKSAGKDLRAAKATYPAVIGLEKSRREALLWTRRAVRFLEPLGSRGSRLTELSGWLLGRFH
jgi:geranylgeranyl diphosphate synthase, type II